MKALRRNWEEKLFSVTLAMNLSLILLFCLPLIYVPGVSTTYASLRYFFFGSIVLILGIATAYTWIHARWIPRTLFRNWYGYGLIAYLGAFIIVSVASTDRETSFFSSFGLTDGVFAITYVTIFALTIYTLVVLRGKSVYWSLLRASVIGATILSLFTILSPDGIGTWFAQPRSGATTGNSSIAGTYVLLHLFFALILFAAAKKTSSKVWWMTAVGILGLSPLFVNWQVLMGQASFSGMTSLIGVARGAALGIVFGVIMAILTYLALQKSVIKKSIGIGFLVLVLGGTILGGIQLFTPTTTIHQRFVEQASPMRLIFWDIAWQGFMERPVVGWGPGTFDSTYHTFFKPEMLNIPNGEIWVSRTHNLFFETLVTGGVVLMAGLLFFLLSIVVAIVKAKRKATISAMEASLLIGALSGWLFQAQFIFESLLSLAILGVITGMFYGLSAEKKESGTYLRELSINEKIIFWSIVCGAIVLFIYTIALPYQKDRTMNAVYNTNLPARATRWSEFAGISPMGDGYDSIILFNKVHKAYNENAKDIITGDPLLKEASLKELDAIGKYMEELRQSRKGSYGLTLIAAHIDYTRMRIAGTVDASILTRARGLAKESIGLSPTDPQPYWLAGQIEMLAGNRAGAKDFLEQAVQVDPTIHTTHYFILQLAATMKDTAYYHSSLERAQQYIPGFTLN
ncbi:MAG: O-antigen ligase family protein [Minisyncoccia bacterium]